MTHLEAQEFERAAQAADERTPDRNQAVRRKVSERRLVD
jgi:hypothetical protein